MPCGRYALGNILCPLYHCKACFIREAFFNREAFLVCGEALLLDREAFLVCVTFLDFLGREILDCVTALLSREALFDRKAFLGCVTVGANSQLVSGSYISSTTNGFFALLDRDAFLGCVTLLDRDAFLGCVTLLDFLGREIFLDRDAFFNREQYTSISLSFLCISLFSLFFSSLSNFLDRDREAFLNRVEALLLDREAFLICGEARRLDLLDFFIP